MAAEDRRTSHPLVRSLLREGHHFSFFQAVRLLHSLYPEAPRVGEQGPPKEEVLRFTSHLALEFPPGDVNRIETTETTNGTAARYRMSTAFLGLYGVSSPLPSSYTEDLLNQEPDCLERGFYDLFQHRLLSLFFRAWERYRYTIRFLPSGTDYFSERLGRLTHVHAEQVPESHSIHHLRLLTLSGLLAQEPRSAANLIAALRTILPELNIWIEQFVARWMDIPGDQQCRLGASHATLSSDAHLGDRITDRASTFRVVTEAEDFDLYVRLLPGGDLLARVRELIDLFNTDYLDYQVEVRLSETAHVEPRLGANSALLGWSTWVGVPATTARCVRILFQGALHGGS